MADLQSLSTKQKALKLNLDHSIYGTFAEIGAGQEVARFFSRETGRQIIIRGGRHAMALERVNYDKHEFFAQHATHS